MEGKSQGRGENVRRLGEILGVCALVLVGLVPAEADERPVRPPITGIVQVKIYVSDADKAREFYEKFLGFTNTAPNCGRGIVACLVVNDRQQIQLVTGTWSPAENRIAEISYATADLAQLRAYLLSKGLTVGEVSTGADKLHQFSLKDPEGHAIRFVQPAMAMPAPGAPSQISARLIHAGFIVHDRQVEDHFYKDILGFHLYWQGGMKDNETSWASMQVPDGTDWLEYMLNISPQASRHVIGVMNHIALGVTDIQKAKRQLLKNGGKPGEEPKLGRDGKWQLNLYDPDDTRVEFMEFKPVEKPCCSEFAGTHPTP
jgi:catechol 2,3-dioxygenase-like lactoylglutathione lyase family enzyme